MSARRRPPPLQAPPSTPRAGPPLPSPLPSPIPSPFTSPSSSPNLLRLRPLLLLKERRIRRHNPGGKPNCGEVTGSTAAECIAVFCCCPLCVMDFVFLTTLRLPAGLCRRAIKKRRQRRRRKVAGAASPVADDRLRFDDEGEDEDEEDEEDVVLAWREMEAAVEEVKLPPSEEMARLEEEMWEMFNGTGFWRSPSRRELG